MQEIVLIDPETTFKHELDVFGEEVNEAIQCFYAEQTIHNEARKNREVYLALNRHAAFWNIASRALQANAIIVLGRIFEDRDNRVYCVKRLLELAKESPEIFSREALKKRRGIQEREWERDWMRGVYVPTARDFARLERYTMKKRAAYRSQYKVLRDKFFAHRERREMSGAFASAPIQRLERVLVYLSQLHDSLWHVFNNGVKPRLKPVRRSAKRILKLPKHLQDNRSEQEWITRETQKLLTCLAASHESR